MLLRTIFLIAFVSVLAETVVHGAMALADIALRHRALIGARSEVVRAATLLQNSLAAQISAGVDPSKLVAPVLQGSCVASTAGAACALRAVTTISFVTPTAPSTPPPSDVGCSNGRCTTYLQANDLVGEGRVSARIATAISSPSGEIFAKRGAAIGFRTFTVPPYVALSGTVDDTTGAVSANGVGDDGGTLPTTTNAGTLIDVVYQNSATGARTPANVWRSQAYDNPIVSKPWDP